MNSTPNHSGSKSSAATIGRKTGTQSRMIPISSRNRPRKIRISTIAPSTIQREASSVSTKFSRLSAPPVATKTEMKARAPMVIHRIIAVTRSVSVAASDSIGKDRRRVTMAEAAAPSTPTAAASVGVAIPA